MIISRPTIARMCHFMIGVLVDREIESGSHNFFLYSWASDKRQTQMASTI